MKRRILALLLCTVFALGLFGCAKEPPSETAAPTQSTAPTTVPTAPSASELYAQAKAALLEADSLCVAITDDKTISVGQETYRLKSTQDLRYTGMGTGNAQIALTEELEMEDMSDKFEEFYTNGTLYTTIFDEYRYRGAMTEDAYLARLVPAVLLDESLYADTASTADGENTRLEFSRPTAPEHWAMPADAQFHTAYGSALLDADGNLLESSYIIQYSFGGSHVTRQITAVPDRTSAVNLTAPTADDYIEVSSPDALRLYDTAIFYLYATDAVTTTLTETIVSQAAACVYNTQDVVNYWGAGEDYAAKVDYSISVQLSGQSDSYSQTELYRDGAYTLTPEGEAAQTDSSVDAATMVESCQGYLSENIPALDYVTSISCEEVGNTLYLELGFTEEYGDFLCEYACSNLFDDENLLNDLATAYAMADCSGYVALDKYTGLPTAMGILYSASHTIEGTDYILNLQSDQSVYLASHTAYEEITGEALPEEAPAAAPTPLFYKVTGADGQQMYLLGTIHVGDARTAYLPQEIYDALDASDALAVEADIIAFEEAMQNDPALAMQVMNAYMYSDGSTTKDHLSEETYNDAVKLLKASGNYNAAVEMMKPSMWQSSISNYYIRQGYALQTEKGVDMRLLKLAKDKGLDILEVESGLFQMEMFGSYSDELQAFLLEDLLKEDPAQYHADTEELFALWCAGDEAVLREAVLDDISDLTDDELALYEEYNKAMTTDRNAAMLDVAIEYLESGDTVFYAVGLAHLLAGNGLVDTLQDAGYTVEQVTFG